MSGGGTGLVVNPLTISLLLWMFGRSFFIFLANLALACLIYVLMGAVDTASVGVFDNQPPCNTCGVLLVFIGSGLGADPAMSVFVAIALERDSVIVWTDTNVQTRDMW